LESRGRAAGVPERSLLPVTLLLLSVVTEMKIAFTLSAIDTVVIGTGHGGLEG
jgi:hypothetical protein